jgi:ribosomal protein S14
MIVGGLKISAQSTSEEAVVQMPKMGVPRPKVLLQGGNHTIRALRAVRCAGGSRAAGVPSSWMRAPSSVARRARTASRPSARSRSGSRWHCPDSGKPEGTMADKPLCRSCFQEPASSSHSQGPLGRAPV